MSGAPTITGAELRRAVHALKTGQGSGKLDVDAAIFAAAEALDARATGTEAEVCADIAVRQVAGVKKYGATVAGNQLPMLAWARHLYEELLDAAVYLKRLSGQPAFAAVAQASPTPHGWAYRYPCGTIRFNNGVEVNGLRPIEAIPYWLGGDQVAHHPSRIFRAGFRSALQTYRPDLVDEFNREWPQDVKADEEPVSRRYLRETMQAESESMARVFAVPAPKQEGGAA